MIGGLCCWPFRTILNAASGSFTLRVAISGDKPESYVLIEGTPLESVAAGVTNTGSVNWSEVDIVFTASSVHENEQWILYVDNPAGSPLSNSPYTVDVDADDTLSDVVGRLLAAVQVDLGTTDATRSGNTITLKNVGEVSYRIVPAQTQGGSQVISATAVTKLVSGTAVPATDENWRLTLGDVGTTLSHPASWGAARSCHRR